jgi:hypothetical protein
MKGQTSYPASDGKKQGGIEVRWHSLKAVNIVVTLVMAIALMLLICPVCFAWTEIKDLPRINYVSGVAAIDLSHIWLVSNSDDTSGIYFYNGTQWTKQDNTMINSIDPLDESHIWAVGRQSGSESYSYSGAIRFYNGESWSSQAYDPPPESIKYNWLFSGVSALDDNHVWAVGRGWSENQGYVIEFFNGQEWHKQTESSSGGLNAVYALDSNHVWAVGDGGLILFFDGHSWTEQGSGTTDTLHSVTAVNGNHAWAGGGKMMTYESIILFYDGLKWSPQGSMYDEYQGKRTPLEIYGIAALDENHVYAVSMFGLVAFFDGIAWSQSKVSDIHPENGICTAGGKYVLIAGGTGFDIGLIVDNPGEYSYYFAEGTTRDGFNEWLCLQNPGDKAIEVKATYMLFGGEPADKTYAVPATSRVSINVNEEIGPGRDVSVKLASDNEFYAERPMYFNYKQGVEGFGWTGGHCATGTKQPDTDWYFAEGTTRPGFEEWVCIQNPNNFQTEVTVDYIFAGAYTQQKKYMVGPDSRISVFVNGDVGLGQDLSLHVYSNNSIVAERPMYFNYGGVLTGGHDVIGTRVPQTRWYFAEGTTRPGFQEYLAVQNANNADANITLKFLKTDGTETTGNEVVRANSRWTLNVNERLGAGVDSSLIVESDQPVVAERPIYFNYQQGMPGYGWTGGHDVVGATTPKTKWFFAEGCSLDNFDEYICIGNPGEEIVHVDFKFMLETGQVVPYDIEIGPKTRRTVKAWEVVGRGHSLSTSLISNKPVVAERPMYFNYNGWNGGHDVVGF